MTALIVFWLIGLTVGLALLAREHFTDSFEDAKSWVTHLTYHKNHVKPSYDKAGTTDA